MALPSATRAQPAGSTASEGTREAREAAAEAQLTELKRRVVALAAAQKRAEAEKSSTLAAVREADRRVAEAEQALAAAEAQRETLATTLAAQQREREVLSARLSEQREALARLVRAAYAQGRHEQLKLLLAEDQISRIRRTLTYHRHLQSQRSAQVAAVLSELETLAALTREVETTQAEVAAAAGEAQTALAALATERDARRSTLAGLETEFASRSAQLTALGRDQKTVEALLADLRDALSDIPKQPDDARPFASRRGQLPLPVEGGQVRERFGMAIPGGQLSEGVRFAVARGTSVHAVAPGRVAYADWLRGYGLLLILDHGDGWMSLYAQSDRLERGIGDWVRSGDVVARAGSSGGAADSALYFELRRNGQPVDPRGWWR